MLQDVTQEFLEKVDKNNPPTIYDCVSTLMGMTVDEYEAENANKPKNQKWPIPRDLQNIQLAMIVSELFPICCIACAGQDSDPEYDMLGIYQTQGSNKGLYVTDENSFRVVIQQFKPTLTYKDFQEVLSLIRTMVPRRFRCTEPDLIAVNNGIFDYKTKELYSFSHKLVFLSKSKVNYDKYATNVVIHNDEDDTDWDVESWMQSLSDDPEIVGLLWEILGAIIRPHVRWNKSAWLYSETGNNGKGTLCELMRELCGPGTYTSIPLSSFSKDFMLEPLTHSTAIIVDENDVGVYIDKAANLKAVITNDVIQINRKNKIPISYQFYGFMVQCLNELPKIKDRSDSFFRRQLFIPMTKCFTGVERKYIKNDYLHRPEVLQYVMKRVLETDYHSLSEPEACKAALADYKEHNDPVRQFADEIMPILSWNFVPFTFLYELFKAWFKRANPSGSIQGRNTFINDIINVCMQGSEWVCLNRNAQVYVKDRMDGAEPLISSYDIVTWMKPDAGDKVHRCMPDLATRYRGLLRRSAVQDADMAMADDRAKAIMEAYAEEQAAENAVTVGTIPEDTGNIEDYGVVVTSGEDNPEDRIFPENPVDDEPNGGEN